MRSSIFALDEPSGRYSPVEFRRALNVSERSLDTYRKDPSFPQGELERRGRMLVRTWSATDVVAAEAWLAARFLPGRNAGPRRLAALAKARRGKHELDDLVNLAGRVVRSGGAAALANALRVLWPGPLKDIPVGERAAVRAELVATLQRLER